MQPSAATAKMSLFKPTSEECDTSKRLLQDSGTIPPNRNYFPALMPKMRNTAVAAKNGIT
jgi:hypothetical protein